MARDLAARFAAVIDVLAAFYGPTPLPPPSDPLAELVNTILSQSTNDINRDRAFAALLARFDSYEAIRDATEAEVIEAIRPAGLANQKGPRIQAVLRAITAERGDLDLGFLADWPSDAARDWLQKFKGVGPKTATIVLLFALQRVTFPVDTHIYRITGRLGLRPAKMSADAAHDHFAALLPPLSAERGLALHLQLIRLGREICQARQPHCGVCPLQAECQYYQTLVKVKL